MAQTNIGSLRFRPRDTWVSGTSYAVDDIVSYKNKFYACTVANSSTTNPLSNTSQWSQIGGGTYDAGEWNSGTSYAVGDIIKYTPLKTYNAHHQYADSGSYIAIAAGSNKNPETQTAYWKKISDGTMADRHAFLSGINEGYVPTYKTTWDSYALSTTVGMGDSFGEFKTPGSHLVGNGKIQYINKRHGLMQLGGNTSHSGGTGANVTDYTLAITEAQFSHISWFQGTLPTSPTTAAPKLIQVEGDMYSATLALFDNGEVHYSGYNGHGQRGFGTTEDRNNFNQCGYGNINRSGSTNIFKSKKVIRIASSADGTGQTNSNYALVRNSDDSRELYAWGYNGYGQLGQGNTTDYYTPTLVSFDQNTNGKIIEIWATGSNYAQFFLLTSTGKMFAMGYNGTGVLGVGDVTNRNSLTLVKAWGTGTSNKIKKFNTSGGNNSGQYCHYLVIRGDGTLWTWGYNGYGGCGHGHTQYVASPMQVYTAGYSGITATQSLSNPGTPSGSLITDCYNAWMYGGQHGSMLITRGSSDSSNTAYSCGYNGYYQLSIAQATTTNYSTLQTVQYRSGTTMTGVIDLASNCGSSSYTNMAVKKFSDKEWYYCGYSNNGGAWAAGQTDSYNQRQQTDPDFISGNYRLKNNLMYPKISSKYGVTMWKYYPFGHSSNKFGMYVDMESGRVYTTGYSNDNNFINNYRGSYWTKMIKLKGT
jgi:alpha-tubulin suppressor-like RCC1 family protein